MPYIILVEHSKVCNEFGHDTDTQHTCMIALFYAIILGMIFTYYPGSFDLAELSSFKTG
jgi:hypothetical protein